MPEFLEKRYNKESRSFLSIISLVSYVLTKVAVTVYAGGIVFKEVLELNRYLVLIFLDQCHRHGAAHRYLHDSEV